MGQAVVQTLQYGALDAQQLQGDEKGQCAARWQGQRLGLGHAVVVPVMQVERAAPADQGDAADPGAGVAREFAVHHLGLERTCDPVAPEQVHHLLGVVTQPVVEFDVRQPDDGQRQIRAVVRPAREGPAQRQNSRPDPRSHAAGLLGIQPLHPALGVKALSRRGQPRFPHGHPGDVGEQGNVGMARRVGITLTKFDAANAVQRKPRGLDEGGAEHMGLCSITP
ncbi:hypothetical protein GALL_504830 [mine drainage metagenome]|uniref:Uncharacterized protein n=1 Tax=mine drainage metagenome TaxID=410659 RepID=A0A1J5P9I0_9ZZZZ